MTSFCVLEVGGQEVFVCIHVLWSFRGSLEFTRVRATTNHYDCVRDYIFHAPFCLATANGCKGKKLYKIPLLLSVSFHFMFLFKLLYLAFENYSKYLSCLPIIFIIIFCLMLSFFCLNHILPKNNLRISLRRILANFWLRMISAIFFFYTFLFYAIFFYWNYETTVVWWIQDCKLHWYSFSCFKKTTSLQPFIKLEQNVSC